MRTPPKSPSAIEKRAEDKRITQVRRYKVITPLFGGGVDPAKADQVTVVRATEIRGHLRFWWRATRGGQFEGNLDKMREAEAKIWGSAANEKGGGPSDVLLYINLLNGGRTFQAVDRRGNPVQDPGALRSTISYAAFPLRDVSDVQILENVEFELHISYPKELEKDISAALWAWDTFGGIGARTRRGFGALHLVSIRINNQIRSSDIPTCQAADSWLREKIRDHVTGSEWPIGVPHLAKFKIADSMPSKAIDVWEELIKRLESFRQAPLGRRPGTAESNWRPGRSYWPEPEEIRRLTGQRDAKHQPLKWQVHKFPRAVFGLPIIFHFKDKGDPDETTLKGKSYERWASPLILRPLICKNGQAVGLAAILEPTPLLTESANANLPGDIILDDAPGNPSVKIRLTTDEARKIRPLNGNPDVLQAFLDTL